MRTYNKLVRDRIPAIIAQDRKNRKKRRLEIKMKILRGVDFKKALLKKLVEEAKETAAAKNKAELQKEIGDV